MTGERTVIEGVDHPQVILVTDPDESRLRERVRALCDDRWPYWSRSYCGVIALVAGWDHRVGVDIEFLQRPTEASWSIDHIGFRSAIMTREEQAHLPRVDDKDSGVSATNLWCSKEALAKALGAPRQMDPAHLTGPAAWGAPRRGVWHATLLDAATLECDAVGWVVYESR